MYQEQEFARSFHPARKKSQSAADSDGASASKAALRRYIEHNREVSNFAAAVDNFA